MWKIFKVDVTSLQKLVLIWIPVIEDGIAVASQSFISFFLCFRLKFFEISFDMLVTICKTS